ncbi:unnamed protein product, partial [marine sediment metagenome]
SVSIKQEVVYYEQKDKGFTTRKQWVTDSHGRRTLVNLKCKADLCLTPDGQIIIDTSKTDCPPEQLEQYLKAIVRGSDTKYVMGKVKDRKKNNSDQDDFEDDE